SKDPYKITDLIKFGTITDPMAQFVRACVRSRLNMLVSGGTGSGKTTTLNVLSSFIPEEERVVTVEDAAERSEEHTSELQSPCNPLFPYTTLFRSSKDPYKITDLIKFGTITDPMAQFVRACVRSRLNMLVSGGTGSGKTTTLNVLSSFIPEEERVVTVEDAAELQLNQEHVVTLESRPATVE